MRSVTSASCKTILYTFIACCIYLAIASLPVSAMAQEGTEKVFDPFAPPSAELIKLTSQLKVIKHELIFSTEHAVVGLDFCHFRGPLDGRLVQLKDFEAIDCLPQIRILRFDKGCVGDDWLPLFAKCKDLEELVVMDGTITSGKLQCLAKLSLLGVSFAGCKQLDDDAMETLADWEKLKHLSLSDVPISDNGVYTLRGLTDLETLDLSRSTQEVTSRITNASLKTLCGFTKLRKLNVNGTSIDDEGVEELQRALPNCSVLY